MDQYDQLLEDFNHSNDGFNKKIAKCPKTIKLTKEHVLCFVFCLLDCLRENVVFCFFFFDSLMV